MAKSEKEIISLCLRGVPFTVNKEGLIVVDGDFGPPLRNEEIAQLGLTPEQVQGVYNRIVEVKGNYYAV
ncbi:MAG: hypothetical protein IPM51_12375 [Sphingobacteriaceae bacterium]|nr:hypothetical protein [Sphingobacteriaceae bacterium]